MSLPAPPLGAARAGERIRCSVVVPVYDEVDNLTELTGRIHAVLRSLGEPYELIYVDDGSRDGSGDLLRTLAEADPETRVIRFRRNFGQAAALSAGFDHARGEIIVTLDADLQNAPEDIPEMIRLLETGYDLVCGWRRDRKDSALVRKVPSALANWLIRRTTGVPIHDSGCTLKVVRRDLLAALPLYGGMHRFIPALAADAGARIAEVSVRHEARTRGESKYGVGRFLPVLIDLLFVAFTLRFSRRPLYFFAGLGILMALAGAGMVSYLVALKVFFGEPIGDRPLLLLGTLFVLAGLQLSSLGLLAGLQYKFHLESREGTAYSVLEVVEGRAVARTP